MKMLNLNSTMPNLVDAIKELASDASTYLMTPSPVESRAEEEPTTNMFFPAEFTESIQDSNREEKPFPDFGQSNVGNIKPLASGLPEDLINLQPSLTTLLTPAQQTMPYHLFENSPNFQPNIFAQGSNLMFKNGHNYNTCQTDLPTPALSIKSEETDDDDSDSLTNYLPNYTSLDVKNELSDDQQQQQQQSTEMSDDELLNMPVRQLNKMLKSKAFSPDQKNELKRRRRLLKNRGYAQTCREKRIYCHRSTADENVYLKKLLSHTMCELNTIRRKYEDIKKHLQHKPT